MKYSILAFLALLSIACGQIQSDRTTQSAELRTTLTGEDQVRQLVLSDLLDRFGPTSDGGRRGVYISIDKSDPSTSLLKKMGERWPSIHPISEAYVDELAPGSPVKDKGTQQPGVKWYTNDLVFYGTETAETIAGYYSSNLGGYECKYLLRKKGDAWTIVAKMNCLSS